MQECLCIFQPGNFTGWDSEGVNGLRDWWTLLTGRWGGGGGGGGGGGWRKGGRKGWKDGERGIGRGGGGGELGLVRCA